MMDKIEEIKKLKALFDQGAITEEEFQKIKNELILNDQKSSSADTISEVKHLIKLKRRKGMIPFLAALIVLLLILLMAGFHIKNDNAGHVLNIFSNPKENINSNSIDTLSMFNNIIYEKGAVVGNLVIVEFVTKYNKYGLVFNVPGDKMWTPLFFEYEDLGNNYYITIPKILTEQNKYSRVGRTYYDMNIYDDSPTNTWWEKGSGFYLPKHEDFKSIKLSMRNRQAISGKNAIYINGHEEDVHYKFFFFEEPLQ